MGNLNDVRVKIILLIAIVLIAGIVMQLLTFLCQIILTVKHQKLTDSLIKVLMKSLILCIFDVFFIFDWQVKTELSF